MTRQAKIGIGIVAALALLSIAAALVIWSLPSPAPSARNGQATEPKWKAAIRQAEAVQEAKRALLANGTITKIDCASHEIQADGATWSLLSIDVKRKAVETLSTICRAETGFSRVTVIHNQTGRKLAEFSGYSEIRTF